MEFPFGQVKQTIVSKYCKGLVFLALYFKKYFARYSMFYITKIGIFILIFFVFFFFLESFLPKGSKIAS